MPLTGGTLVSLSTLVHSVNTVVKLLSSVLHNYLLSQCTSGSALHEASRCGKEDTVKLLLDKGIIPPSPSPSLPLYTMVFNPDAGKSTEHAQSSLASAVL